LRTGISDDRLITGVVCTDDRCRAAARTLKELGHAVAVWDDSGGRGPCLWADYIIFGLPLAGADGRLKLPAGFEDMSADEVFDGIKRGARVFAGMVPPDIREKCRLRGTEIYDYCSCEKFAVENAAVTAECAVSIAMADRERLVSDSRVLVTGFGRIGKLLSLKLRDMGARVDVSARSAADRAWIRALGMTPVRYDELADRGSGYDTVFNTVPAEVITAGVIEGLKEDCRIIDLASMPGGTDTAAARRRGIAFTRALALPGREKSALAGRIIAESVLCIIEELEGGK